MESLGSPPSRPRAESVPPASRDEGEITDPTRASARQVARLAKLLRWLACVGIAVGAVEIGIFVLTHDPAYGLGAAAALAVGLVMLAAGSMVQRGRVAGAVHILSFGILGGALVYILALPGSPAIAIVPVIVIGLALQYLEGAALRRLVAVAWATGVLLVSVNMLLPRASELPTWFTIGFRTAAFAGASGAVFLLLWHSSERLREALAEARSANGALRGMHARLKDLDRMKTQFMNAAAHELRTPMTPVLVEMHLLKSGALGPLTPPQRRALAVMERNLDRLNRMGEDVLDVARFQAGKLRLARQPMELRPLVQEAGESFRDVAASQGLALEVHAAPGLQVHADPRRLAQVVDNLLGNAIKFTPPGGRVTLEARSVPGGCVVEVCDTGLGIRPEDLGKLFQPFSQVHDAVDRARPGSGLGLHVCRGVVEAHGGRIWASSEGPGRGARFTFSLPAAASEAPQAPG